MLTHGPGWTIISMKATADIGLQALGPAIVFSALALLSVIMRWYSRACITRRIGMEDFLITSAMITSIGITGIIGAEFHLDMGNGKKEVLAHRIPTMLKLVFAQSLLFHTCVNLIKASILFQYVYIFSYSPTMCYICYIMLVLVIVSWSWGAFGVIFLCTPVRKYWDLMEPGACMDPEKHFWSSAIFGIILDFGVWILPMPLIGRLAVKGKQRIGLIVLLGLGGFVCITSILRLVFVHDAAESEDVTKLGTYALVWSTIEVNVAIICASLLVLKPLFMRWFSTTVSTQISNQEVTRTPKMIRSWSSDNMLKSEAASKEDAGSVDTMPGLLESKLDDSTIGGWSANTRITKPESC